MMSSDLQFIDFGAGRGASFEFAAKCAPGLGLAMDISDDAIAHCTEKGISAEKGNVIEFDQKNAALATFAINLMPELPGRAAFHRALTNIVRAAKNYTVIQHSFFDRDAQLALKGLYVADNFSKRVQFKPTVADYLEFVATHKDALSIAGISLFTFGEAKVEHLDIDEEVSGDLDQMNPKSMRIVIGRKNVDRFRAPLRRVKVGKQIYSWEKA